ncbi:MAG: restriction endonuclease [Pseudomonadota bacterium]
MATKADVPKVQDLIPPTVQALRSLGGSGTLHEINDEIASLLELDESVQGLSMGDSHDTWFGYRCRWARTYLKWMELVENSERGVWALTQVGAHASRDLIGSVWKEAKKVASQKSEKEPKADIVAQDEGVEAELGDWKDQTLEIMKRMPPETFERLCQRVLREAGFSQVVVTGRSGDGGIDGSGVLRINLISFQTLFQCKRYKDAVGSDVVRDFRGAMIGRADKGLIITTGRFTAQAQKEATRDGAPAIELIDGDELCDILREMRLGVSVKVVETTSVDGDFFARI